MVDQAASDEKAEALPGKTDEVVEGDEKSNGEGKVIVEDTALVTDKKIPAPKGDAERSVTGSGSPERGLVDRFREGRDQFSNQAGEKARGLVSQGLERTADALANVSKMVGDTAAGIEERLGQEYGEYARKAAGAIENAANTVASKDPDELIEDTRNFVRNSPGLALAGAAVVGFVVARILKTGLPGDDEEGDDR